MRTTHVKAHTRGAYVGTPDMKRENYIAHARRYSLMNIRKAAKNLTPNRSKKEFMQFMTEAFVNQPGNYTSPEYAAEWVDRFNKLSEWRHSDNERRQVLKKVYPGLYGNIQLK